MTRGGFCSRSMTLTVSTLPSAYPPPPLLATSAILPLGTMSTLYGKIPVGISYFSYTTFCPSIFRNATLLTTGLTASALVPSAEMATWATLSPIATVSFRQIQGLREDKAAVNMKYLFLAFFALLLLFVGGFYLFTRPATTHAMSAGAASVENRSTTGSV